MEWKKVPISSICEGIYEGPHATPPSCESGAYYLGIPALTSDGQIDFSKVPRICEKDYKKWTKRVTPKYGDIVFTNEATLNLYARIPMDFYGCLGRRLGLVRPLQDKVDVDYLFYYFFSPYWRKVIALKKVSGSTVERILMKKFPHFPVLLPPLNIQNKIASILSDYDNLIENNNKRIRLLEQMAENLYKEWFVRFRFPGHEKAEFENGLPKGWVYAKLEDILSLKDSIRIPLSSLERSNMQKKYPYYGAASILDYVDDYLFDGVYLLLGEDGSVIDENGYPYIQYVWGRFWVNNHAHVIEKKGVYSVEFLYCLFKRMNIQSVVTGVAQPKISQGRLFNKKVIKPCDSIISLFDKQIQPIFAGIRQLTEENNNLSRQRDLLLPRLMSGKLEVKV